MKNIYELTSNYLAVQEMMEEGQLDPEMLADTLEAIEGEIEVKAENYGLIMQNLEALSDGLAKESARLLERKKSIDSNIASMKNALSNTLLSLDKTKFKTEHFAFSFRKSESVVIQPEVALPEEFVKTKTTITPDKTALKKALKAGQEFDGVYIATKQNLQIK